jgi:hypothetical protein
MNAKLSPIVSEFETEAEAASYDSWFRETVEASLADTSPRIAHDDVMAEMDAIIDTARKSLAEKS